MLTSLLLTSYSVIRFVSHAYPKKRGLLKDLCIIIIIIIIIIISSSSSSSSISKRTVELFPLIKDLNSRKGDDLEHIILQVTFWDYDEYA